MFPVLSSLIQPCWDTQDIFCSDIAYDKFYKISFGGRNVCAHSLIGIYWMQDYGETSHALKCEEKIGLKLELGKCGETKVFQLNFYGISFFQFAF